MLRADTDFPPPPHDAVGSQTVETPAVKRRDSEPVIGTPSLSALAHARSCLETALDRNESWRALRQLEAREETGEWLDVMESDDLRNRLTHELAAQPDFLAWQFVDAAIACLEAGAMAQPAAAGQLTPATDASGGSNDAAHPAPHAPTASEPWTETETEIIDPRHLPPPLPPPLPPSSRTAASITVPATHGATPRALSLRIPTLLPHDLKNADPRTQEPMSQELPAPTPTHAPHADATDDNTLVDAHAIGIEEADVKIVRRGTPAPSIVNTRLPPLPLSNRPPAAPPRPSRAPVAKWADSDGEPDDYRPIGSALDEAQVTILTSRDQDEARARAERRALGIAPDREAQMRRFLKALSGE